MAVADTMSALSEAGRSLRADAGRPLRADAERNRRRLLDAAADAFAAEGLDVGVAEIAQRAGIGRGTLFRNFETKQDLIAAIVVDRMEKAAQYGRGLRAAPHPGEALFAFLDELLERSRGDRTLFEALADTFLAHPEIRRAHAEVVQVLEALLGRAQQAAMVRRDVCAVDLLMMIKGITATASAFRHVDAELAARQFDLLRDALSVTAASVPLRGRALGVEDIERALELEITPA